MSNIHIANRSNRHKLRVVKTVDSEDALIANYMRPTKKVLPSMSAMIRAAGRYLRTTVSIIVVSKEPKNGLIELGLFRKCLYQW